MSKINWPRFIIGGLVAALLAFFSDGFLHEKILEPDWQAVYAHLGAAPAPHSATGLLYFVIFDLGRGFVSVFLYVMMRSYFGRGVKTAVLAGIIGWIFFSITTTAQFIPLGFYSNALWLKAGIFQLVTAVITTIIGAALYKDSLAEAPAV